MKNVILEAKKLTKAFPGAEEPVLKELSVSIFEGDFTIIMGPSGAGKSTLSGMDGISGGSVIYKEKELNRLTEKQMADHRIKEFGFVFQQTHLVSNLTLFENVAVAGYLDKTKKDADRRAAALLAQMHVGQAKDRLPSQVSGGEAQRAAIARAVINHPGLLFADEPTGALNKRNSEEVLDLLTELNRQGQSILMVTHDIRAALRGTRILYLEDGVIPGEMQLPPYEPEYRGEREEKVSAWLSSLSW